MQSWKTIFCFMVSLYIISVEKLNSREDVPGEQKHPAATKIHKQGWRSYQEPGGNYDNFELYR